MGVDKVGTAAKEPAQFVDGDVDLAGRDHFFDFFEILGAIKSRARRDEFPSAGAACLRSLVADRAPQAHFGSLACRRPRAVVGLFRLSLIQVRMSCVALEFAKELFFRGGWFFIP